MTWQNDQLWERERARLRREAFAASVEEISQKPLELDEWEEGQSASTQNTAFMPPRLRLQARPNQAARPNPTRPIAAIQEQDLLTPHATAGQEAYQVNRTTRTRLHAAFPGQVKETEHIPSLENPPRVARSGSASPGASGPGQATPNATGAASSARPWPRMQGGRGIIKQGQAAISVPNAAISERCVVNVMLAGNPGPVLVQYISLHPRMGFTIHLTSSATTNVPFNYVIWPF